VKYFDWDEEKNVRLKSKRKIGFEEIRRIIEEGKLLDTVDHPNKARYPNQKMFVVAIDDYVYLVPFVEDDEKFFLKAIFPSRKATKKYLRKRGDK
jgi:hypothetical protein